MIKFKVLDKETGKVYPPNKIVSIQFSPGTGEVLRVDVENEDLELLELYAFKLLQFTGKLDKNKKEIYLHDKIKFKDWIGIVEWDDMVCKFYVDALNCPWFPEDIDFEQSARFEIIGSKYEVIKL